MNLNKKFTLVADENMPHIETLFGDMAEVRRVPGRTMQREDLEGADVLLCRSITEVDKSLLEGPQIKFVGTATIGIDHLDIDYLDSKGIRWANAAGCNAEAVAQYVMSGIAHWSILNNKKLTDSTVGIVGAGNVGTAVAKYCEWAGIEHMLCDPPLEDVGDAREFNSFEAISKCDVVTFHVPMEKQGRYPTFHMVDSNWLSERKTEQLVINASRGGVIDNKALADYLSKDGSATFILDVFENEPAIDSILVELALVATPHIAGHTLEGKNRGSYMVYKAACEALGIPASFTEEDLYPESNQLVASGDCFEEMLLDIYDIAKDGEKLVNALKRNLAQEFDELRKGYVESFKPMPRRDYSGWVINKLLTSDKKFWEGN